MKIFRKLCSGVCLVLLLSLLFTMSAAGMADYYIPDSISVLQGEEPTVGAWGTLTPEEGAIPTAHGQTGVGTVKLFGLLPLKRVEIKRYEELRLCPGGGVFGISAPLGGALITSLSEVATESGPRCPAKEAGLVRGDLVTAVDGTAVTTAAALAEAITGSAGRTLTLTVIRAGEERTLSLTPCYAGAQGAYRAGILVKDTVAGIGTVTFIDPETGFFGGLGHGVYDGISPAPVTISRGAVTGVGLTGVIPGTAGTPGELRGHLEADKRGALFSNTDCGVFGMLVSPELREEAIPIGLRGEVTLGEATILSTVEPGKTERYTIEITALRGEKNSDKSFSIRVTDPALLSKTGGIVQGMSGSPIIQNGKLIGAVTHVLINDPTTGYGIFIENMLAAAEMPMAKAS